MPVRGYGKMLEVDLASRKIVKSDLEAHFARKYLGGVGFGCKILYDEVDPNIDPLGPR